jgi:hypothetical protein
MMAAAAAAAAVFTAGTTPGRGEIMAAVAVQGYCSRRFCLRSEMMMRRRRSRRARGRQRRRRRRQPQPARMRVGR